MQKQYAGGKPGRHSSPKLQGGKSRDPTERVLCKTLPRQACLRWLPTDSVELNDGPH